MTKIAPGIAAAVLLLCTQPAVAQRGYPRIETVFPGAVTRGATAEVTVTGRYRLEGATQVLFEMEGLSAEILGWEDLADPALPKEKRAPFETEGLRLKVTVAPGVPPGIQPFRILTKGSLSALGHLLVTDFPSVVESESNDSPEEAQEVKTPQTINGRLDREADLDVFRFHADAGARLTFVVHAARLQKPAPQLERNFSDIQISLHESSGKELAAADDWFGPDPLMYYEFEREGIYFLHLREARYHAGKDKWWYSLSIGSTPVITSVFPFVVPPGTKTRLELRGFNTSALGSLEVTVPAGAALPYRMHVPGASAPVLLGVSELPLALEAGARPMSLSIPGGVSGRIGANDEADRYRFAAKAGERFEFEVQANSFGSVLDPLIEIRDVSGGLLHAGDDRANVVGQTADGLAFPVDKDPRLEWIAPADGDYEIHVRDANYFGSPDHVYFLSAQRQQEDFALVVDDDRMPMGPGESVTSIVTVERRNGFRGPVRLLVRGLPAGVEAMESIVPSHLDQGNLVLTAARDAKPSAARVQVAGVAEVRGADGREHKIERMARVYAPMGQAGGRSFIPVDGVSVAVTEGSDIIMEATPREVSVRPGETFSVNIRITRDNYTGPIEMNVILWNLMQRFSKLPAGVFLEEKESKTSLAPNESEGRVTFRVQPDAPPLDQYLMAVMGQITYNRIFMTRVAAPFRLTILPPKP